MFRTLLLATALVCQAQVPVRIPWLATPPAARLDLAGVAPLELRAGDGGPGRVQLRAAADAEMLYVQVTSDQRTLAWRDRAYQNGDGLILVLANLEAGAAPSRRFRVMGFSPQPEAARNWQFAFTWYRDVDLQMTPLPGTGFAWRQEPAGLSFELRIPWTALAPWHPLLTPELGLNACFVRAEGQERRLFQLREDPFIQSEQRPRAYLPVRFDPPPADAGPGAWFARPSLGRIAAGAPLTLAVAAAQAVELKVRVLEGEGTPALPRPVPLKVAGAREATLDLPLPPGGYQLEIQGPGRTLTWGLTVLPEGGVEALQRRLDRLGPDLRPGTRDTLGFRLEDAASRLAALAPSDPAPAQRRTLEQVQRDLLALEGGRDPVADQRGLKRRAYRSALDRTLQPYSLRVPARIQPGSRYPLLVYLHGSGQSDQGALDLARAPEGWFELAPFGRGTSNCFSADHAQDDLREAIAAVLAQHPVDPARIVLAGFSMGGYGGYRTAFERPGFFRGLAIFSGVPDVASRWLGPGHPDFLDPAALAAFKDLPIFIFHGTLDRNCPFEKTERLVALLRQAGAQVTFVVEEGKGHEPPAAATLERYFSWMASWSGPVAATGP
jgi:predicted esterase